MALNILGDFISIDSVIGQYVRNKYLLSLIVLVVFFLLSKFVVFASEKVLLRIARKTKSTVDDKIVEAADRPLSLILLFIGILLALVPLGLPERANLLAKEILQSLIIITLGYLAVSVIVILIMGWVRRADESLVGLLSRFTKIIIYALVLIAILDLWGIKVGPLLASLGIAGIAIAFALQSTLGNIFGGMSMIIDKSIKAGDVVKIDESTRGTVLDVGLRSTKIRTFNNELVIIPNGQLANSKIENWTLPDEMVRVDIPFSVAYGSDIDKVKEIVLHEVSKIKGVVKEPESHIKFMEMGASSLNFTAFIYCDSYRNKLIIKDEANAKIYNALNKHKILIPFPQLDVWMRK